MDTKDFEELEQILQSLEIEIYDVGASRRVPKKEVNQIEVINLRNKFSKVLQKLNNVDL